MKIRSFACVLFAGAVLLGSEQPASIENMLPSIKRCLYESGVEWTAEQQEQYVGTIRRTVLEYRDRPDFSVRLDIIRKGFPLFWHHINKSACSGGQLGVYKAEIRWYVEHLMMEGLACEKERKVLKSQYRDLFGYAVQSLRAQFPLLSDEIAESSLQDGLKRSYERIEAPLMPIYSRPFTDKQIKAIKTRWDRSHGNRSALWRNFSGNRPRQGPDAPAADPKMHPHYLFTKRCLHSLLGSIWAAAATPPAYCIEALQQARQEDDDRRQTFRAESAAEKRLRSRFGTRVEQVEQWSFIFAALLETACEWNGSLGTTTDERVSEMSCSEQAKGGDGP